MTCARPAGYPMCETCTAAGLVRCPSLGAPLPLVEGEKAKVIYRGHLYFSPSDQRIVWGRLDDATKWDLP